MKIEERPYYRVTNLRWLRPVLYSRVAALALHWTFQGVLNMEPAELRYKLALDLVTCILCTGLLLLWLPLGWAALVGIAVGHTLNFLLNGQIWVVMKHFGAVQHTRAEFDRVVEDLRSRVAREPAIVYAAAFGSLARGEWSPTSDLDVRLVRRQGFSAALAVCWFATCERSRALIRRFPLDIFVLDSVEGLRCMREHDTPVVLIDTSRPEVTW
jgi:hypothetical protein